MPRRRRQRNHGGKRHIRRFMEPCLLLLLRMDECHGYNLADSLAQFGLGDVDSSLVYRMLRGMEEAGLIESEWEAVSSGPARRVYRLTDAGDQHLGTWVESLRETDLDLHHFLNLYEQNVGEG